MPKGIVQDLTGGNHLDALRSLPAPVSRYNSQRQDANETIFLETELQRMDPRVFDQKHKPLDGGKICPVAVGQLREYDEAYKWELMRGSGKAAAKQDSPSDVPRVNAANELQFAKTHCAVIGYEISNADIMAARDTGKPLEPRLARYCIRALEEYHNDAILRGLPQFGFDGFFNNPNAPIKPALNKITLTSAPTDDLATLHDFANSASEDTNTVEQPSRFVIADDIYNIINDKRLGSVNDTSVLDYWAAKNQYVAEAGGVSSVMKATSFRESAPNPILPGTGAIGVALDFNEEYVGQQVIPPRRYAILPQLWGYLVVYVVNFTEVYYRYPKAVAIRTGM